MVWKITSTRVFPACRALGLEKPVGVRSVLDTPVERVPAPPESLAQAKACVREFGGCFWFRHPEASHGAGGMTISLSPHLDNCGPHLRTAQIREGNRQQNHIIA